MITRLTQVEIRKVKEGEYFKRKPDSNIIYVRNHYDRGSKSYSCSDFYDMNREIFIKASKLVWVGFTF